MPLRGMRTPGRCTAADQDLSSTPKCQLIVKARARRAVALRFWRPFSGGLHACHAGYVYTAAARRVTADMLCNDRAGPGRLPRAVLDSFDTLSARLLA